MENKFIKERVQFKENIFSEWDCLATSSFYKAEVRKQKAEKEIIDAYMNAAESIYLMLNHQTSPCKGLKAMKNNQMVIPFLYMCRHTIELSIKYKLEQKNIEYNKIHKLKALWNNLKKHINIDNEDFEMLIDTLSIIDDNGCKLRYAVDKQNNEYNSKPIFINSHLILETTKKMHEFLTEESK